MRDMKDSGVQWIGEMPKSWGIIRFKYLHNGLNTGEAIDKEYWSDEEDSRLFYTAGLVPIRTDYTDFPLWKYTTADDLLLARNGTPYVYFPKVGACYTDHIIRASMKPGVCKKFVQYCLQRSIASVVVETVSIPTWSASLWNKQELAWPTYDEQIKIADILDEKCSQVDTLITNVQAQIEKLKAYKQSVITEVVTKGLDPTVPMKDSGVEWIGDIPEHWTECRIKNAIFPQEKAIETSDQIITCFRDGEVTLRSKRREDGFTVSLTEHGYHGVDVGDLVIHGLDAFAGAIGCSDSRGKTTPVVHVCSTIGNNRYFMYYLRAMAYGNILMDLSNGVRVRSSDYRNFDRLGVFGIVIPPIQEQNQIVDYLDAKCSQIDHLISIKQAKIEKLEQYKRSLIYEYVTGKREVS